MARVAASLSDILRADSRPLRPLFLHDGGIAAPIGSAVSTNTNLSSGIGGAGGFGSQSRQVLAKPGRGQFSPVRSPGLFGLVLVLVAWKLIEEHRGGKEAFSKVKVDGTNLIKIGLMATIFLIIARYFFARYSVPGISDLIVGGT
jgi:hypothetical protein